MSRNNVNKTTAKATLTQMINIVLQRMEHFSRQAQEIEKQWENVKTSEIHDIMTHISDVDASSAEASEADSAKGVAAYKESDSESNNVETQEASKNQVINSTPEENPANDASAAKDKNARCVPQEPESKSDDAEKATSETVASTSEKRTPPTTAAATSTSGTTTETKSTKALAPGRFGFCVTCKNPANNYCMQTKHPVCSKECKEANVESLIIKLEQKGSDEAADQRKAQYAYRLKVMSKFEVLGNDAHLLCKALCKLSMKAIQEPPEPLALRSKTLSLELLLNVLKNSGPSFQSLPMFVDLIKEDLVKSLLKNSVTVENTIFRLSSSLFECIIMKFKPCLKTEIGVFLDTIYLKILASSNSTYEHKVMAMEVFSKICQDPQTLVGMFLNYDCDMENFNVFQQMVTQLEKIAQGRFSTENWYSPEQEAHIRRFALELLGATMHSLVTWTQEVQDSQANVLLDGPAQTESNAEETDASEPEPEEKNTTDAHKIRPSFSKNYTQQKEKKAKLERGILKFNTKPKDGLKYLWENDILEKTPESVCSFFKNNPAVDKVQIGDWMGLPDDFNKKVLYCYVESMNFRNMDFDKALRNFLQGFRLPREPEKIDRMMEKFADQYTSHNPGLFPSAEAVYVLAYAVIMLNTDAHSNQIKDKMTKEQFIRNSSSDGDLSHEVLSNIYDRIVKNEIKMKDDPLAMPGGRSQNEYNPRQRIHFFLKEGEKMVKESEQMIESIKGSRKAAKRAARQAEANGANGSAEQGHMSSVRDDRPGLKVDFYEPTSQDLDAAEPMFEILWYSCLGTLSVLLEESDDPRIIKLCLTGYQHAIRIASVFNMDTPRLAFVNSLKKFTLLGSTRQMRDKNIEAIKMLLQIAHSEGNYLKDSWGDVLTCVSEFERLHLTTGQPSVDVFQISPIQPAEYSTEQLKPLRSAQVSQELQDHNSKIIGDKIDWALVDKVFTQSAHLNSEAIVDFVNHLRLVSEQELASAHAPRVFCLQKIVEITYYNMGRIRLVWTRIWKILSDFFVKAGCHSNLNVSMYAIDSLRQLAMKFLEKDELANFHFQKQFLKPFEYIMANNRSSETRELVVQCLSRMILARVNNVKSGWKSVFIVLTYGAKDSHQPLVVSTFAIVRSIMTQYFLLITETTDTIDECINCLVAFGCNRYTDVSLQAIEYLLQCASYLGAHINKDIPTQDGNGTEYGLDNLEHAAGASLKVWFLLLTGLSTMINDPRLEVRSRALQALFGTLHNHGRHFNLETWRLIFRGVLFPIFDDVAHTDTTPNPSSSKKRKSKKSRRRSNSSQKSEKSDGAPASDSNNDTKSSKRAEVRPSRVKDDQVHDSPFETSWLQTTCLAALSTLVELFSRFHEVVSPLLPELLNLINNCIDQPHEEMSHIGVKCWVLLVTEAGPKLSTEGWTSVAEGMADVFIRTLPHELQSAAVREAMKLPLQTTKTATPLPVLDIQDTTEPSQHRQESHESHESTSNSVEGHLPFNTPTIVTKCKVQLMLMDALYEMLSEFFPVPTGSDLTKVVSPSSRISEALAASFPKSITQPEIADEDIAVSREIVEKVRRASTVEGRTRAYHGPAEDSTAPDQSGTFHVSHVFKVLKSLGESIEFARTFNGDLDLRTRLWEAGFMQQKQSTPPELFYQEAHGLQVYLQILFRLYAYQAHNNVPKEDGEGILEEHLLAISLFALSEYVGRTNTETMDAMKLKCMDSVVITLLEGIMTLPEKQFRKNLSVFFGPINDLITIGAPAVRAVVRRLYDTKFKEQILGIPGQ